MRTFAKFGCYISAGEVGGFEIVQVINQIKASAIDEICTSLSDYILDGCIDFDCDIAEADGYIEITFEVKHEYVKEINAHDLVVDVIDHYYAPLI